MQILFSGRVVVNLHADVQLHGITNINGLVVELTEVESLGNNTEKLILGAPHIDSDITFASMVGNASVKLDSNDGTEHTVAVLAYVVA